MPITYADAERTLTAFGYSESHETSKVKGFALGKSTAYLKKPKNGKSGVARPLVIDTEAVRDFDKLMSIRGIERSKGRSDYYHNANMKAFGLRLNGGTRPTRHGYDFDFDGPASMLSLLNELK